MKQTPPKRVVLLANGDLREPAYARSLIRADDVVIVANGGTRLAYEMDVVPDMLIGDHDSLPEHLRLWLEKHEVPYDEHPAEKDATDLELALHHAISLGRGSRLSILFLGLTGSRTDHTLGNFSLLVLAGEANVPAEVVVGREHIYLVYDELELIGEAGQTVSLLPWGGDAHNVHTEGLKWELRGETLPFGPARGISNIMRDTQARISLTAGMLMVCHHRGEVR
ncbi:MAG: thiamine diphosphokinase [Ardenticatenaceae bacterium]